MKVIVTLLLSCCVLALDAQLLVDYPYNPDSDDNAQIGVNDLTSLLAVFGGEFESEAILVDGVALAEVLTSMQQTIENLQSEIAVLQAQVVPGLAEHSEFVDSTSTLLITGINIQLKSGDAPTIGNGKGNLIVGWNRISTAQVDVDRTGSHNIVVGDFNEYSGTNSLVVGAGNMLFANYSSLLSGGGNTVYGESSAIVGGQNNTNYGEDSAILGGWMATLGSDSTTTVRSTIVGGKSNRIESGNSSTILGGNQNLLSGIYNTVVGGRFNDIEDSANSLVLGGESNVIRGGVNETTNSVIVGGRYNSIDFNGYCGLIAGGYQNKLLDFEGDLYYSTGQARAIFGGGYNKHHGTNNSTMVGGNSASMYAVDSVDSRGNVNLPVKSFLGGVQPNNTFNTQVTGSTPD